MSTSDLGEDLFNYLLHGDVSRGPLFESDELLRDTSLTTPNDEYERVEGAPSDVGLSYGNELYNSIDDWKGNEENNGEKMGFEWNPRYYDLDKSDDHMQDVQFRMEEFEWNAGCEVMYDIDLNCRFEGLPDPIGEMEKNIFDEDIQGEDYSLYSISPFSSTTSSSPFPSTTSSSPFPSTTSSSTFPPISTSTSPPFSSSTLSPIHNYSSSLTDPSLSFTPPIYPISSVSPLGDSSSLFSLYSSSSTTSSPSDTNSVSYSQVVHDGELCPTPDLGYSIVSTEKTSDPLASSPIAPLSIQNKRGNKKTPKGKTAKLAENLLLEKRFDELYDIDMDESDCRNEEERFLNLALRINSLKATKKNLNVKIAIKRILLEELSPSMAAIRFGFELKSLMRQLRVLTETTRKEMRRLTAKAITPDDRMKRLMAKNLSDEEKRQQVEDYTQNRKVKPTTLANRVFFTEEEVIQSGVNSRVLHRVLHTVFGSLYEGWQERRGIRETILTLEKAILEGSRPSLNDTPRGGVKLDIESDIIPYYRLMVAEFKKDPSLSRLVRKKGVMISGPPMMK